MKNLLSKVVCYFKTEFLRELIACLLIAVGLKVFSVPNLIVGGGVSGIASVLYVLFNIPIGISSMAMNIPLLLIGWKELGSRFILRTLRVVLLISLSTDVFTVSLSPYSGEKLLVAIVAGVLLGTGLGLIMMKGDSTGGTDIIVKLIQRKYPHISLGNIVLLTDASIVTMAAIAYKSLDTVLYGAIMIFVSSTVVDKIILGAQSRKLAFIITSKGDEVTEDLLLKLKRGVTVLFGRGGYTKSEVSVLMCVVENRQIVKLKQMVYEKDPKSFIIIATAAETLGTGFKKHTEI